MPAHAMLLIEKMNDDQAARKVAAALEQVAGVKSIKVELLQNLVRVMFHSNHPADEQALLAAVDQAGYPADRIEMEMQ